MARKTYDKRAGRQRPPGQRSDWTWLEEVLAAERRYGRAPRTPGEQRRHTQENPPHDR